MGAPEAASWELIVRPRRTPYFAYVAALCIAAIHIVAGLLLKTQSSGVLFRTADQVAIATLGLIIAGAVLLLALPRLRVGPTGISVRNLLSYRLIPWPDVVDVVFPHGARWARVELLGDEYIPLMAIQAVDKGRAVAAMDTLRTLMARYRPDLG